MDKKIVNVGDIEIGKRPVIIAGPCSIEGEQAFIDEVKFLYSRGIRLIRGGAYKPRTSPYSFQGLGDDGLRIIKTAKSLYDIYVVSEVMDPRDIERVYEVCDVLQIGSRNMANYSLLKEIGRQDKPVFLKRGMSATIEEWLLAAEYIAKGGNEDIILCERGIRTFETYTRNTLDLSAVPAVHELSPYPVIVDPSHGTGKRSMILPMSKAAIACGADGIMVEVHPNPEKALSDGEQSLDYMEFEKLIDEISDH
ncbi:MAG: 3-deoxy-7-phosphoheptulonate synthase [Thermoanaerobacteraceae bacterium]|nr:3-deoxy-7-phosphoheptulonate synthase [Thermoanaerobacteraceae bacterium]